MKYDVKTFYHYLSFVGKLISIWPVEVDASKTHILFHEIKWWICFSSVTGLLIPLVLGVYYFRNDTITVTKTLSELTALIELFMNMIMCRIQSKNFQNILYQIRNFIENADDYQNGLLQKYIDRYKDFQLFVGSSFMSTGILFSCIPIITKQLLPADTWYPFSIESSMSRTILYTTHVIAIFQTALGISVDFTVAMMLWYSALQTELLKQEIDRAMDVFELKGCARSYIKLLQLTKDVKRGVRFIILKTNGTMILAVVCGAFQLINHEPFEVLIRFILMVVAGCLRLYVSAKPADDLKENFELLSQSAFYTALRQRSFSDSKIALMIARHSQKPMVISVSGVIKAFTLQYYASFLSTTVTYFVNLRAVLEK